MQVVPIYQKKLYIDERFKHKSICPQLHVSVSINDPLFELIEKNMVNLFQLSFEEMHNLPEEINEGYECKLATLYPMESLVRFN